MRDARRTWGVVLLLLAVAGGLRFFDLGTPNFKVYDEFFYARDACKYVTEGQFFCGVEEDTYAHPPVAKWLIAAGIWMFAPTAIGARVMVAFIGTLSVVVLFFLARKIFDSVWAGAAAGLLLAVDPLHLVNSRAAVLDTFAGFFVLVAMLGYLYDREASRRPTDVSPDRPSRSLLKRDVDLSGFRSRWLLICGIALGLAVGSKWTVAPVLIAIIGVVVWDAVVIARSDGDARPWRRGLRGQGRRVLVCLVLVPMIVYGASYVGRITGSFTAVPWDEGAWARRVVERQVDMARYHTTLRDQSPEDVAFLTSPAWSWPLLKRPMPYSFMVRDGTYYEILATGNPLSWWPALAALIALAVVHMRRRTEGKAVRVVFVGFGGTYLYWLAAGIGATQIYILYFVPAVPFLCLGLVWAWTKIYRRTTGKVAVWAHAASIVALFAFLLPVLIFRPLSKEGWESRMLFSDCRPHPLGEDIPVAGFRFEADDLRVPFVRMFEEGEEPPEGSLLPLLSQEDGWCWR